MMTNNSQKDQSNRTIHAPIAPWMKVTQTQQQKVLTNNSCGENERFSRSDGNRYNLLHGNNIRLLSKIETIDLIRCDLQRQAFGDIQNSMKSRLISRWQSHKCLKWQIYETNVKQGVLQPDGGTTCVRRLVISGCVCVKQMVPCGVLQKSIISNNGQSRHRLN